MTVIAFRARAGLDATSTLHHPRVRGTFRSPRGRAGRMTGTVRVQRLVPVPGGALVTGYFIGELRDDDGSLIAVGSRRGTAPADLIRDEPLVGVGPGRYVTAQATYGRDELLPAWDGTPWDFHGTSQAPREGKIACGYFVSTTLLHLGLQVERVRMAQQASELIVKSLVSTNPIRRSWPNLADRGHAAGRRTVQRHLFRRVPRCPPWRHRRW